MTTTQKAVTRKARKSYLGCGTKEEPGSRVQRGLGQLLFFLAVLRLETLAMAYLLATFSQLKSHHLSKQLHLIYL